MNTGVQCDGPDPDGSSFLRAPCEVFDRCFFLAFIDTCWQDNRSFHRMNWLDYAIIALLCFAAFKGYSRGLIVEVGALVAVVLGIWAGIHFSDKVVETIGLEPKGAAVAFLITFVVVLVAVHLLARLLTTMIDIAQLGLPNKLAGVLFGALRKVFVISVALNLLAGYSAESQPTESVRKESVLYEPVRVIAPLVLPVLGETKWVNRAVETIKEEVEGVMN